MPVNKIWTLSEPFIHSQCLLGEGIGYNEDTKELRFLDINNKQIHFVDLSAGPESQKTITTDDLVGVTAEVDGDPDKLVAAGKYGFATIDRHTGKMDWLQRVYQVDGPEREKRFWAGSMNDTLTVDHWPKPEGSLFRFDPDGSVHRFIEGEVIIPNGIAWNCADTILYFTESETRDVYAFDFNAETGDISNKRVFFHWDDEGLPDGLVVDEEDCLWSALYYGSKVIRISPTGELIAIVQFPCPLVTCPTLAGTDLIVTTARNREQEPTKYGGDVFRLDVGVKGKPSNKYKRV